MPDLSYSAMAADNRSSGDSESSAAAAELEYMRKEDSSWHPCHVALSVTGVGLVVNYENADSGDIVLKGEDALTGLRMRSLPLKGDDCVQIQEGHIILATEKLQTSCLFFDAVVEKVLRVRHSKRAPCRCTFKIKWLNRDLHERTLTITSSSIMKLATASINEHPIISSFLSMLRNSKCSTSPVLNVENDDDHEMDLHELLGKQIEVISNSVGNPKKRFQEDILFGIQFDEKGEIQRRVAKSEAKKPLLPVPSDSTPPRRTTRSQNKLQNEIKNTNPMPPHPFIHESPETQSLLNPLTPLASFASLLSKLPQESKFRANLNFAQSLYELKSLAYSQTTTSISHEPQSSDTFSEISTKKRANGNESSEVSDTKPSLNFSAAKRKLKSPSPPKTTKIARTALAKDVENKKLVCPSTLSRVTRSAVNKINKAESMDAKQGIEECISEKLINLDSGNRNDTVPTVNLVIEKEGEAENSASIELTNSTSTTRLTRSKVLEGKRTLPVEATPLLKNDKFAESNCSSSLKGKLGASNGKIAGSAEIRKVKKNDYSSKKLELRRSPRTRTQKS